MATAQDVVSFIRAQKLAQQIKAAQIAQSIKKLRDQSQGSNYSGPVGNSGGGGNGGGGGSAAPVSTLAGLPQTPALADLISKGIIREGMAPETALGILAINTEATQVPIDIAALKKIIGEDYATSTAGVAGPAADWMAQITADMAPGAGDPNAAMYLQDPIFGQYAGGLQQMQETANTNEASDQAWMDKQQQAMTDYYNGLMAQMSAGTLVGGGSGGGGGGGGHGGGGRHYGGGGGHGGGGSSGGEDLGFGDAKTTSTSAEQIKSAATANTSEMYPGFWQDAIAAVQGAASSPVDQFGRQMSAEDQATIMEHANDLLDTNRTPDATLEAATLNLRDLQGQDETANEINLGNDAWTAAQPEKLRQMAADYMTRTGMIIGDNPETPELEWQYQNPDIDQASLPGDAYSAQQIGVQQPILQSIFDINSAAPRIDPITGKPLTAAGIPNATRIMNTLVQMLHQAHPQTAVGNDNGNQDNNSPATNDEGDAAIRDDPAAIAAEDTSGPSRIPGLTNDQFAELLFSQGGAIGPGGQQYVPQDVNNQMPGMHPTGKYVMPGPGPQSTTERAATNATGGFVPPGPDSNISGNDPYTMPAPATELTNMKPHPGQYQVQNGSVVPADNHITPNLQQGGLPGFGNPDMYPPGEQWRAQLNQSTPQPNAEDNIQALLAPIYQAIRQRQYGNEQDLSSVVPESPILPGFGMSRTMPTSARVNPAIKAMPMNDTPDTPNDPETLARVAGALSSGSGNFSPMMQQMVRQAFAQQFADAWEHPDDDQAITDAHMVDWWQAGQANLGNSPKYGYDPGRIDTGVMQNLQGRSYQDYTDMLNARGADIPLTIPKGSYYQDPEDPQDAHDRMLQEQTDALLQLMGRNRSTYYAANPYSNKILDTATNTDTLTSTARSYDPAASALTNLNLDDPDLIAPPPQETLDVPTDNSDVYGFKSPRAHMNALDTDLMNNINNFTAQVSAARKSGGGNVKSGGGPKTYSKKASGSPAIRKAAVNKLKAKNTVGSQGMGKAFFR